MFKFLILALFFVASVGTGFAAAKKPIMKSASTASSKTLPAWLQTRIIEMQEKYKGSDQTIAIEKYNFNEKTFFLMPPAAPCCDMPTELVEESGKSFCQLGGGFANHTDPQCRNFREVGKLIETVWSGTFKK